MTKQNFKLKAAFLYILAVLLPFGFMAFSLDSALEANSLAEIKTHLKQSAEIVAYQLNRIDFRTQDAASMSALLKGASERLKCRLTLINSDGSVLADSEARLMDIPGMENHAQRPEVRQALFGSIGEDIRHSATLKINTLYIAVPARDNNQISGVVRAALPLRNINTALLAVRKAVITSLLFAIALAFAVGVFISRWMVLPVQKIIRVAQSYRDGDFRQRVFLDSHDEIRKLADTLNSMAEDIESKIRKIELQNQQLKAIFQSMAEGVIITDKGSRIVSINASARKIFAVEAAQAEGRLLLETIPNSELSESISQAGKEAKYISKEVVLSLPARKICGISISPIFERAEVTGCLTVIHDITELRKLEEVRKDFVANVSHELKTPLTSIKGFVETLLEGALEDKENNRNFLKVIEEHANRLEMLVNDLLTLSYLESGSALKETGEVDLRSLADKVLAGFKGQIKKKTLKVTNELPEKLPVCADPGKIEQVFTNLIDNAVKFNRENGTVRISAEIPGNYIKILVEDSGIGIPIKDIPRIFERFYRVDKARSRELGGTGLGLSIVKHIVELHGGSVGVESTEGLDSKFWFVLPR